MVKRKRTFDWEGVEYGSAEYHKLYRAAKGEVLREKKRKYERELFKRFPARERARRDRYKLKNPLKVSIHKKVSYAVAHGKLSKLPCAVCGSIQVVGHHDDYNKPLEVTWLCELHHKARHREHKSIEPYKEEKKIMDIVKDKFIKMRLDEWRKVKLLALELSAERGGAHVSLPAAISEAVHFYRAQRNKAEASNE